jgi:hypothetical protein
MNLRCTFHVSPVSNIQAKPERKRLPSFAEVDVDFTEEQIPRGRSFETWSRARGWASED